MFFVLFLCALGQEACELVGQYALDLGQRWALVLAEFVEHAGDGASCQAAGDDEVEVFEVGGDVDCQAVHGDPALNAEAECADFGGLGWWGSGVGGGDGPDAGGALVALGLDVEVGHGVDDGGFE